MNSVRLKHLGGGWTVKQLQKREEGKEGGRKRERERVNLLAGRALSVS